MNTTIRDVSVIDSRSLGSMEYEDMQGSRDEKQAAIDMMFSRPAGEQESDATNSFITHGPAETWSALRNDVSTQASSVIEEEPATLTPPPAEPPPPVTIPLSPETSRPDDIFAMDNAARDASYVDDEVDALRGTVGGMYPVTPASIWYKGGGGDFVGSGICLWYKINPDGDNTAEIQVNAGDAQRGKRGIASVDDTKIVLAVTARLQYVWLEYDLTGDTALITGPSTTKPETDATTFRKWLHSFYLTDGVATWNSTGLFNIELTGAGA